MERLAVVVALAGTCLVACSSETVDVTCDGPFDSRGDVYQFVVDRLLVPKSPSEADTLGLNIDGDDQARIDNGFGHFLVGLETELASQDLQANVDRQFATAGALELIQLQTVSLTTTAGAALWMFPGADPSVSPCLDSSDTVCGRHLDGMTSFAMGAVDPLSSLAPAQVVASKLTAGPTNLVVQLPLFPDLPPLILNLVAARTSFESLEPTRVAGMFGGAITAREIQYVLLPSLVAILNQLIEQDCNAAPTGGNPCGCSTARGSEVVALFDAAEPRCELTVTEVQSSWVGQLLDVDLDLLDQDGSFGPGQDGVLGSLSVGFGLSAVGANFPQAPLRQPDCVPSIGPGSVDEMFKD